MLRPRVRDWLVVLATACGTPPAPRPIEEPPPVARRRADVEDDCAPKNGKPAKPLARKYDGVAAAARCDREVFTIMGGVTHMLGVRCEHCHVKDNYPAPTHNKEVANWMARELIPSLEKRGGGELWCNDCHAAAGFGRGRAKILGNPRNPRWAIEWMTTHLVERFDAAGGAPLRCKTCHVGNLGTPEFKKRVILSDHLPPRRPSPTSAEPSDAGAPLPSPTAPDGGSPDAG